MPIAKLLSATALTALGLTAESEDDAAINAIDTLVTDKDAAESVLASVRTRFKLADDAGEEVVLAAIETSNKSGEPDPSKYVEVGALNAVTEQLAQINEERVLASVDAAIAAGKLTPAQKDWAVRLGKKDVAELNSYLDGAPVFQGGRQVEGKPEKGSGKLTEDEAAICSMMGISQEDFIKTRETEEEAA